MGNGIHETHEKWMQRAIDLALNAWGRTSPNPLVGAIVVKDGEILGSGRHLLAGEAHAEVEAIEDSLSSGASLEGATLYVTLEPCSTFGRTPPCTEKIISSGVGKVVIGCEDRNPAHRGRGIQILRDGGIEVACGVLEEDCVSLNESFFHWIETGRPFVILKMATTLDGCIATEKGESQWITGEAARKRVQELRKWADAIMVGGETARRDRPSLTVRGEAGWKQPRRLIATRTMDICEVRGLLSESGPEPEIVSAGNAERWEGFLYGLGREDVTALLVEGGGELAAQLFSAGAVDRIEFHIAPKLLGGRGSRRVLGGESPMGLDSAIELENWYWEALGDDVIVRAVPRKKKRK